MKNTLLILSIFIFSISLTSSCKKKVMDKEMTVIKNCTGTYLKYKDDNYKVCNSELLDSFLPNHPVTASFNKIKERKNFEDQIVCEMAFEFKSVIEVTSIK